MSGALAVTAVALVLQLVDVLTGHQVRRAGRAAGSRDRDRVLTWTIAWCSIALVLLAVGVDLALRLILESGLLTAGLLGLVGLVAAAGIVALLAARALRRPQTGYQVIRDELRALPGTRLARGRLADFRSWVDAVDARQDDVHQRVLLGRLVRAVPPLLALASLVLAVALALTEAAAPTGIFAPTGAADWWLVAVFVVLLLATGWLAVSGARLSLARDLALNAVHQKQRAEVFLLLEELERKVPRRATGLTERVSRALAILREQQGQESRNR
jgi:hypothetical protein